MTDTATVPALPAAELVGSGMSRAEWLVKRRLGIGGSDVAALLGISPWHSQASLFMEKRGELEAVEQTDYQRWGLALEEPIRQAFEEDTDMPVLRLPKETMYRSKELPIALITPDGLTAPKQGKPWDALFEAKTSNVYVSDMWDEGVPPYYLAQAQWGLAVSGWKREDFGVLVGLGDFRTFSVEADPELHSLMFERAQEFWDLVQRGIMPDIDGSKASNDAVSRRFKKAKTGLRKEGGIELAHLLGQWSAAKEFTKDAERMQDELENRIKLILGDAEYGTVNDVDAVSWKQQTKRSVSPDRLMRELPLAASLITVSSYRTLRTVKPAKTRGSR